jgi:hypothetical protein
VAELDHACSLLLAALVLVLSTSVSGFATWNVLPLLSARNCKFRDNLVGMVQNLKTRKHFKIFLDFSLTKREFFPEEVMTLFLKETK